MKGAPVPALERERLKVLSEYHILDTAPEADYDFITQLAARLCNKPIALLSFLDANRRWVKSAWGLNIAETSRGSWLSTQAVSNPDSVLVVDDLAAIAEFRDRPFEHDGSSILFYAGAPLVNSEGYVLGVLCLLDRKPNALTADDQQTLKSLARQVVALLELRRKSSLLEQAQGDLKMAYTDLESIAHIASHDLKSPLNNIISLANLIREELGEAIGADGAEYINFINEAAYYLSDLVSSIHSYSKASRMPVDVYEKINTRELLEEIVPSLNIPENCVVTYNLDCKEVCAPLAALKQILFHLLANAVQYNDKEKGAIAVTISENATSWLFQVADNGEGIDPANVEKAFELFRRLGGREKDGEHMGMGLSIARRLVEKMHSNISVKSEPGKGAAFSFSILKVPL